MKKTNFKKILITVFFLFIIPIFFVYSMPQLPGAGGTPARTIQDLWQSIANIAKWMFSFLVIAGVIGVVIAGYLFVSSGGDSGKVTSARHWLIYSLVGVLIGSFGVGFVNFILGTTLNI